MAEESDIPDEYSETAFSEAFPAEDFREWLEDGAHDETREAIEASLEAGFSLEWSVTIVDHGIDPESIEHVGIHRDDSGWTVTIDGETIAEFDDDDLASDYIWADLYWHMLDNGIEFDKDIHSVGGD